MDRYAAAVRRTAALEDGLLLFFTCSRSEEHTSELQSH